jgi:hypothetical protein
MSNVCLIAHNNQICLPPLTYPHCVLIANLKDFLGVKNPNSPFVVIHSMTYSLIYSISLFHEVGR